LNRLVSNKITTTTIQVYNNDSILKWTKKHQCRQMFESLKVSDCSFACFEILISSRER